MAWAPALAAHRRRTHELIAATATVHRGFFDATLPPVLRVRSGDIVRLETATGNPRWFEGLGGIRALMPKAIFTR